MKPGSFAVFLLALVCLAAAGGGAIGYFLHDSSPLEKPQQGQTSVTTEIVRGFVGRENIEAAYEESRRKWAAAGIGSGAVLGLLCAVAIGSYSLKYRNSGR